LSFTSERRVVEVRHEDCRAERAGIVIINIFIIFATLYILE
jgi:hypothetical protein